MPRLGTAPWTTVAGLCLAACAGEARGPSVAVRDSAGIRIVESAAPTWMGDQGWTVDPEPVLDLTTTGSGPAHELYRVVAVRSLSDGRIAVGLRREIRFFSPEGTYLVTAGREGEGPGEFSYLEDLTALPGDSVIATDLNLRRLTVFGPDGTLARAMSIDLNALFTHVLGDRLLVLATPPTAEYASLPSGRHRAPAPVVAFSADGQILDTVAVLAGPEALVRQLEDGVSVGAPLFGLDSYLAVGGGRAVAGDAVTMTYRVLRGDGAVESIVRADYDTSLRPVQLAAERAATLGRDPSPDEVGYFDDLEVPEQRPAYRRLRVDPTGAVWLQEDLGYRVDRRTTVPKPWQVFSAEGVWLGRVLVPGRFTVHEIGRDYVLGVFFDELDVEHVQRLALRR